MCLPTSDPRRSRGSLRDLHNSDLARSVPESLSSSPCRVQLTYKPSSKIADRTYRLHRKADLDEFRELNDEETFRGSYVISKTWLNQYLTGQVPQFFDPAKEWDPLPTEEPYRSGQCPGQAHRTPSAVADNRSACLTF